MRILVVLILVGFGFTADARVFFNRRERRSTESIPRTLPPQGAKSVPVTAHKAPLSGQATSMLKSDDGRHFQVSSRYWAEKAGGIKKLSSEIVSVWNESTESWDAFPEDPSAPLKRVEKGEDGRWYTIRYFREDDQIRREIFSVFTEDEKWQRIFPLTATVIHVKPSDADKSAINKKAAEEKLKIISAEVKAIDENIKAHTPSSTVMSYKDYPIARAIARGVPAPQIRPVEKVLEMANLHQGPALLGPLVVNHMEVPESRGSEVPTLILRVSAEGRDELAKTVGEFRNAMVSATLRAKSGSLITDIIGSMAGTGNFSDMGKLPEMNLRIVLDASKDIKNGYQAYVQKMKDVPLISGAVAAHTGFTTRARETSLANSRLGRGGAILPVVQRKIDEGVAQAVHQVIANPRSQGAEKLASEYLASRLAEGIQKAVLEIASSNGDVFKPSQMSMGVVTDEQTSHYLSNLIGSASMGMEFTLQSGERVYFPYEKGGSINDWALAVAKLLSLGQKKKLTENDVVAIQKEYQEALAAIEPHLEVHAQNPRHK